MKKRVWLPIVTAALLSSSLTVCAAPQYMADGAVFDPEWYLEQNPDVVAGWSLGTSADAVYGHYTMYGAGEGRKPYNEATLDPSAILPYQGAESTAAKDSSSSNTESASPKNVPVGTSFTYTDTYIKRPVNQGGVMGYHDTAGYGNGWSRTYRYTFTDGRYIEFTLDDIDADVDRHAYVSEATDANGVTYYEYRRGTNDFVMNMMAAYMAQNPDSNFTALMKEFGNQFVVVSADVLYDGQYDYDWNQGWIECEPDNAVYMFVNTTEWETDLDYIANNCIQVFESVGESYIATTSED